MDLNDKEELLHKTLYSYIGYNNVEKINDDISDNTEDIKLIEVPESLDKWFVEFNNDLERKQTKNKYKKNFKNILSKVAIIFLILFISIATLTVTVDAFRVRLFNTIIKNTEKYLDIEVNEESQTNNIEQNIDGFYELEYIPNGFELNYVEDLGDTKIVNYINNKNEEILFNQSPNGTNFQLDSEDAEIKEVDIMGSEGIIIKKEDRTTLFWNNEEYSFYLLSTINEKELISMAKSLIKK
ncbi:MAG: DUF4367 domain-containing protein [Senegalia sp. (in: firmicutes)]